MERWVEETLHRGFRVRLKADRVLFDSDTEHQHLVIFENEDFGRVMMLDHLIAVETLVTGAHADDRSATPAARKRKPRP